MSVDVGNWDLLLCCAVLPYLLRSGVFGRIFAPFLKRLRACYDPPRAKLQRNIDDMREQCEKTRSAEAAANRAVVEAVKLAETEANDMSCTWAYVNIQGLTELAQSISLKSMAVKSFTAKVGQQNAQTASGTISELNEIASEDGEPRAIRVIVEGSVHVADDAHDAVDYVRGVITKAAKEDSKLLAAQKSRRLAAKATADAEARLKEADRNMQDSIKLMTLDKISRTSWSDLASGYGYANTHLPILIGVLRVLSYHYAQAILYGVALILYMPDLTDRMFALAIIILIREILYMIVVTAAVFTKPQVLLFDPSSANWGAVIMYVLTPLTFFIRAISMNTIVSCIVEAFFTPAFEVVGVVAFFGAVSSEHNHVPFCLVYSASLVRMLWSTIRTSAHVCSCCESVMDQYTNVHYDGPAFSSQPLSSPFAPEPRGPVAQRPIINNSEYSQELAPV